MFLKVQSVEFIIINRYEENYVPVGNYFNISLFSTDNSKNKSQSASFINDETVKAAIASVKTGKTGSDLLPAERVLNMLLHYGEQKMARLMIL